jgi:hypothetical protein
MLSVFFQKKIRTKTVLPVYQSAKNAGLLMGDYWISQLMNRVDKKMEIKSIGPTRCA